MILRARVVVPVSRPPIPNGAILVHGSRIAKVAPWSALKSEAAGRPVDLGDVLLMPGLINAHCHLDYTDMAGEFPSPRSFSDWLKLITTAKALWTRSDFAQSWRNGARMLLRSGTTTVADIEAVPDLLPELWDSTPLRVISFLELIGITTRREPTALLRAAVDQISALRHRRSRAGLSPHAPYSTTPALLNLSAAASRERRLPLCIHIAESATEFEMFTRARGEMFDWLKRSTRDMSDCGRGSPVEHVARCRALTKRLLAVHLNYLKRGDAKLLAGHGVSVVHCPRSHAYFRHRGFPIRRLARAGVNLSIGTDSLASVIKPRRHSIELSMFEEMRSLAHFNPSVAPQTILRLATINGARALGLQSKLGELTPHAFADIIAVPFAGKSRSLYETLLQHSGPVTASMINGKWALSPPR